jgi:UPF0271 protein
MRMDLNADLGEGMGDDEALLDIVTSANIATGAHAGGGSVLRRAVAAAAERGVGIGAHPSYRDRRGFGRASHQPGLDADPLARAAFIADLVDQIMLVAREAHRHGQYLSHVKAHGALYNDAVRDVGAAEILISAVERVASRLGYGMAVMTQPGGVLARCADGRGLEVIAEGFADRGYTHDGRLMARGSPGAVHVELEVMVAQALDLARGRVQRPQGPPIDLQVGSLCVHGDTPGAVAAARSIRAALERGGWQVRARARATSAGWRPGPPRVVAFGDRALHLEAGSAIPPGTAWVHEVAARARRAWPSATVVPGLASVLVVHDTPSARPDPHDPGVAHLLEAAGAAGSPGAAVSVGLGEPATHDLPTRYDGQDLGDVAQVVGVPTQEVVRRHGAATWTVASIGFSPGFGYLTGTDPLFSGISRRADPRPRVPRGAVALAAGMCAVYPSATPGGWQLIGSSDADLFDDRASRPARLRVGDRVRFVEVP